MQESCFSPFYLACFAWPSATVSLGKAWVDILITYQHPLRLRRFGSGAPGLLGRGIARQRVSGRVPFACKEDTATVQGNRGSR